MVIALMFAIASLFFRAAYSFEFIDSNDGSDLNLFVSRPDLRPPIYEVTVHDRKRVTPGYWFVAPYEKVTADPLTKKYQPCQIGPQIYDNDGSLVWSGACLFQNRNAYNFRPTSNIPGSNLSLNYGSAVENDALHRKGMGIILSPSFEVINTIAAPTTSKDFDLHEFNVLPDGKKAIMLTTEPFLLDVSALGGRQKTAWVKSQGFQEVDLESGQVDFKWSDLAVNLSESWKPMPPDPISADQPWDAFHINSVDKHPVSGNYLISMRNTHTIYLISGITGEIIWRLGQQNSSFTLLGSSGEVLDKKLPFYAQHDARFHLCSGHETLPGCQNRHENDGMMLISIFDNGGISKRDKLEGVNSSSSILFLLDTRSTPMTAQVIERHERPDAAISWTRGNAQYLENGNVFINWAIQGYLSEHYTDTNGASKCAIEARLKSDRMGIYRSYKFNFTGEPAEPIALVTQVRASADSALSTFYVSWNGATEVVRWNFYLGHGEAGNLSLAQPSESFTMVGSSPRRGFETQFSANGWAKWSFVEAVGKEGKVLGRSEIVRTALPQAWSEVSQRPAEIDSSLAEVDVEHDAFEKVEHVPAAHEKNGPKISDIPVSSASTDEPAPIVVSNPNSPLATPASEVDSVSDDVSRQSALKDSVSSSSLAGIRGTLRLNVFTLLLWLCFLILLWMFIQKFRRRRY